jgi:hypothetical protein
VQRTRNVAPTIAVTYVWILQRTTNQSVSKTYSESLKNKTEPAVLIKPKNIVQTVSRTKSDVNSAINPVAEQINVNKVKSINNGGLLIGFSSKEDNAKFKRVAVKNLSQDYEIKEVKGLQPRVKLVGMSQRLSEQEITEFIEHAVKYNNDCNNVESECKLIKCWPTKKKSQCFPSCCSGASICI